MNEDAFGRLSGEQAKNLREAAARAQRLMIAHDPTEAERAEVYCGSAGGSRSRPRTRSRDARAAQPVYASLEADPQTKGSIERLRAMKRNAAPKTILESCAPAARRSESPSSTSRPKRFPEGALPPRRLGRST